MESFGNEGPQRSRVILLGLEYRNISTHEALSVGGGDAKNTMALSSEPSRPYQ